ncbi:hypothetical protein ALP85_102233 [Pseudomonas syringae pv. syringae]|uniref:Uncharacterized protein n=1 Tax=Pseudomonas syringae pv. solidagae TaxID=264458 RepID=A0A3M5K9I5_PSESX|nr:hypothetical protein ALP85_102233 [Pseudomonas syringae pv. syringae]RMT32288.1 hypothetical protein ALP49_102489 [Pseudomonas syringae pv. solidagae]RMT45483.1 hypothetical protein ALP48_102432 [Pseudomonas syringae pv. solidagae]
MCAARGCRTSRWPRNKADRTASGSPACSYRKRPAVGADVKAAMRVIGTHGVLLRYSLAATVVGPVTNENGWRLQIIRRMHAARTCTTKAPF